MTADRTQGIGGTDIAAIAGISKWKTPMDVFLEKTGRTKPTATTEAMEWGNRLEPVVRQKYEDVHGYPVRKIDNVMIHNEHSWYRGTPDGIPPLSLIFDHMGFQEFKTTSAYNLSDWDNTVPPYYLTQVAWYFPLFDDLGISREWVDFAVLVGGNKYIEQRLYRDDKMLLLEKELFDRGEWFWHDHILKDEPPDIDPDSDGADAQLKTLYPASGEDYITGDDMMLEMFWQLIRLRDGMKRDAKTEEKIKNRFIAKIGLADGMKFADGSRIDYKTTKSGQRRFKPSPAKGE